MDEGGRNGLVKLESRTLSLNNVVSCTLELREEDELLEVIDGTVDEFKRVLVHNGYFTTAPMVFRGLPDSRTFTIMTALGNRVNLVGDQGAGFEFHQHVRVDTDFFYRHWDIDEPVPYGEIEQAVWETGATVQGVYHVILDFYGETVLDLYVDVEKP
jgi:hypothetical protein